MVAKVIGVLLFAWGILMAAFAIANLVFAVLGGGDFSGLTCAGGYLLIGIGASYAGRQLYRRGAKKPEQ
ncbi:MAG: hypothetical protein OEV76_05115 [Anaerolineae bacterium]|nr:hypothetical protein [Anaerolineae bacterium]